MIKLIASDLDGTLLPEGTADINPEIFEVIGRLQAAGITFVAASGRTYGSIMSVFGQMEQELTVISDNGGYGARGGVGMYCNFIPSGRTLRLQLNRCAKGSVQRPRLRSRGSAGSILQCPGRTRALPWRRFSMRSGLHRRRRRPSVTTATIFPCSSAPRRAMRWQMQEMS